MDFQEIAQRRFALQKRGSFVFSVLALLFAQIPLAKAASPSVRRLDPSPLVAAEGGGGVEMSELSRDIDRDYDSAAEDSEVEHLVQESADERDAAEMEMSVHFVEEAAREVPAPEEDAAVPRFHVEPVEQHIDPPQDVRDRDAVQLLAEIRDQVRDLQRAVVDRSFLGSACWKYLSAALGAVVGLASIAGLYFVVKGPVTDGNSNASPSPSPNGGATPVSAQPNWNLVAVANVSARDYPPGLAAESSENQSRTVLVNKWKGNSEGAYWERLATYVEKLKPRPVQEQLVFMNFSIDLSNSLVPAAWRWRKARDLTSRVQSIAAQIARNGLARAYRDAPGIRIYGQIPPRAVLSDLMALSLAYWYANYD